MTLYAASSVSGYLPPGGVCEGHTLDDEAADPEYPYLSISCPVCEPILAGNPFWASTPEERPLTGPELREAESQKTENEQAMAQFSQAFMTQFVQQQAAAMAADNVVIAGP